MSGGEGSGFNDFDRGDSLASCALSSRERGRGRSRRGCGADTGLLAVSEDPRADNLDDGGGSGSKPLRLV